jgi:hypothetical protein
MWKSGAPKSDPQSSSPTAQRSRFRGPYRVLVSLAVLFVGLILIFPLVFRPRVDAPTDLPFGSASSVSVQISNQNVTPLDDVEYSCELSKLTLANGSATNNEKVLTRGVIRKIPGRRAVTVRCESAHILTVELKAAEYTLTLRYRPYPWPKPHSSTYRIAAQINSNGQVTGWRSD